MLWTIAIATLGRRKPQLERILAELLPQAEAAGDVEVVALRNNGEKSIGWYRQALLEDAQGKYISFVDDDDMVEPDFIKVVTEAMLQSDPDYVAFQHAYYENGARDHHVTVTGLQYNGWYNTSEWYVRDITHINPARTVYARQANFLDQGSGEDASYDGRLRGLLKTQAEIHRVLYHYFHNGGDSIQSPFPGYLRRVSGPPPQFHSPAFRWHPVTV